MTFPRFSKRFGQFEALEAKKLFAADLIGFAVPAEVSMYDPNDCPRLGGQEGEPVVGTQGDVGIIDPIGPLRSVRFGR